MSFRLCRIIIFSWATLGLFSQPSFSADPSTLEAALNWVGLEKSDLTPGNNRNGCEGFMSDVPKNCPNELVSRIARNSSDSNLKKACPTNPSSTIGTSSALEGQFESISETKAHAGFGAKLGKCLPNQMGSGFLSLSKREPTEDDRKALVAEYYSGRARLKYGTKQTTDEIAAINSLLEEPNRFSPDQCAAMGSPEQCNRLNACKPAGGLDNQVADTIYILGKVDELKFAEGEATRAGNRQKIIAIEQTKKALLESVPWTNGDEFKSVLERATPENRLSSENIRNAMREQFRATRSQLATQLGRYSDASGCIREGSTCSNFDRVMGAEAPPLSMAARELLEKKNPSDWDKVAIDYLKDAECRAVKSYEAEEESKRKKIEWAIFIATLPIGGGELMAARAAFKGLVNSTTIKGIIAAGRSSFTAAGSKGMSALGSSSTGGDIFSSCSESKLEADFQGAQVASEGCPKRPLAGGPKILNSYRGCLFAIAGSLTGRATGGAAGRGALGAVGQSISQLPSEKLALQKVTDPKNLEKWAESAFKSGAEVRIQNPKIMTHGESGWTSGVMGIGKEGHQFETSYKRQGFANVHDYTNYGVKDRGFDQSVIQVVDRNFYTSSELKEKAFNLSSELPNIADNKAQIYLSGYGTVEGKLLDVTSSGVRIETTDHIRKTIPLDQVKQMLLLKYVNVWNGGR